MPEEARAPALALPFQRFVSHIISLPAVTFVRLCLWPCPCPWLFAYSCLRRVLICARVFHELDLTLQPSFLCNSSAPLCSLYSTSHR